jgi:membrane-associated protease RseP (regulator of RpoE activity)
VIKILSVLAAIGVLGALIVVHELGHFLAARLQGIRVSRFSIGFGPTLLRYQGPKTEFVLAALPLGGYVGFPDDDPESKIPADDPDLLKNRPILDRAIVISAGVIANLVFAYAIVLGMSIFAGVPQVNEHPGISIPQVFPNTAASRAGLKPNDVILEVGNDKLMGNEAGLERLKKVISANASKPLELTIQRDKTNQKFSLTPDAKGKIGVVLTPNRTYFRRPAKDVGELFQASNDGFGKMVNMTFESFRLLTSGKASLSEVSGPVGIVAMTANLAETDASSLFSVAVLISINLAFINILPLPALDGGHLAFLLIEAVRGGKPLPNNIQQKVMQTGLVVLLGLALLLIFKDSFTLIRNGGSMVP